MKHGCSMWGNNGSNPICWTHDTLTPLFRCKRYRAPHFKVFCVLLSTFLYDLSDYWRKRKSLIIKTSCLGHTKHLCPRVYNLMIGACVKCKTLTRLKFCGSHVHVQCLLHLWTIFNTVTIFNSLSEVPLPWTFTSALDTIQYVRKAFLQHFNLQEV